MSKYIQDFVKRTEQWKGRLGGVASFEMTTWQKHLDKYFFSPLHFVVSSHLIIR